MFDKNYTSLDASAPVGTRVAFTLMNGVCTDSPTTANVAAAGRFIWDPVYAANQDSGVAPLIVSLFMLAFCLIFLL